MKKIVIVVIVLALLGGGVIGFVNVFNYVSRIETDKANIELKLKRSNSVLNAVKNIKAEDILAEVNKLRAEKGVPPISLENRLNTSAMVKVSDMAASSYYEHQNPITGKRGLEYIPEFMNNECSYYGENLLKFPATPSTSAKDLVSSWKESKPHYEAMINSAYTKMGVWNASSLDSDGWTYLISALHFCQTR